MIRRKQKTVSWKSPITAPRAAPDPARLPDSGGTGGGCRCRELRDALRGDRQQLASAAGILQVGARLPNGGI